jgi:hypothetical protein
MPQHVDNIGERGARRRRRGGWIWAAVAVLVAIVLMTTHAPRSSRLVLAVPVALAALGFLQAREKT